MQEKYMIVGNPNTGKTSLFNSLTKSRSKTANYSGVTVREEVKAVTHAGKKLEFIDLPGIYSFQSESEDETVTKNFICDHIDDVVVFVCSSINIKKNLLLLNDLKKTRSKIMLIINKFKKTLSSETIKNLEKELGVPILQADVRRAEDEVLDWISSTVAKRLNDNLIWNSFKTERCLR